MASISTVRAAAPGSFGALAASRKAYGGLEGRVTYGFGLFRGLADKMVRAFRRTEMIHLIPDRAKLRIWSTQVMPAMESLSKSGKEERLFLKEMSEFSKLRPKQRKERLSELRGALLADYCDLRNQAKASCGIFASFCSFFSSLFGSTPVKTAEDTLKEAEQNIVAGLHLAELEEANSALSKQG